MNVEIGTEAVQFPEKEYINGIFLAASTNLESISHSFENAFLQSFSYSSSSFSSVKHL